LDERPSHSVLHKLETRQSTKIKQSRVCTYRLILRDALEPRLIMVLQERAGIEKPMVVRCLRASDNIYNGRKISSAGGEAICDCEECRIVQDSIHNL